MSSSHHQLQYGVLTTQKRHLINGNFISSPDAVWNVFPRVQYRTVTINKIIKKISSVLWDYVKLRHKLSTKNNFTKTKLKVDLKQKDGYTLHLYHHTAACPQMRSYNNIRPDLKYVGSPSPDRVYKKRAG